MTAHERSGWRDEDFSRRHRTVYGNNCPMVDIDFLCAEYDRAIPRAIIEYKHERSTEIYEGHPNFRTLTTLADRADLPLFYIHYAADYTWFDVHPINARAKSYVAARRRMTESEYVSLLYRLRGRALPPSVAMQMKS